MAIAETEPYLVMHSALPNTPSRVIFLVSPVGDQSHGAVAVSGAAGCGCCVPWPTKQSPVIQLHNVVDLVGDVLPEQTRRIEKHHQPQQEAAPLPTFS